MDMRELNPEEMANISGGKQSGRSAGVEKQNLRLVVKEYKDQGLSLEEIQAKFPGNAKIHAMIAMIYNEENTVKIESRGLFE